MSAWDRARSHHNQLPIIGGTFESIWGSPEQEEVESTTARIAKELEDSRGGRAQQRMNAMQQSSLAFNPLTQLMGGMYGPQAQIDIEGMTKNPLTGTSDAHPAFQGVPPAGNVGPVPTQQSAAFQQGPPGARSTPQARPNSAREQNSAALGRVSPFRGLRM